jgi:hypothetical protein
VRIADAQPLCQYHLMGILDDKTLRLLRDGQVLGTMHRLSGPSADRVSTSERGVKLEVRVTDKRGAERMQRVILKKVRT